MSLLAPVKQHKTMSLKTILTPQTDVHIRLIIYSFLIAFLTPLQFLKNFSVPRTDTSYHQNPLDTQSLLCILFVYLCFPLSEINSCLEDSVLLQCSLWCLLQLLILMLFLITVEDIGSFIVSVANTILVIIFANFNVHVYSLHTLLFQFVYLSFSSRSILNL